MKKASGKHHDETACERHSEPCPVIHALVPISEIQVFLSFMPVLQRLDSMFSGHGKSGYCEIFHHNMRLLACASVFKGANKDGSQCHTYVNAPHGTCCSCIFLLVYSVLHTCHSNIHPS